MPFINDGPYAVIWRCAAGAARFLAIGGAGTAALVLAACDGKANDTARVVARVNGYEITVHQVNDELTMLARRNDYTDVKNSRDAVDRLIDRQLLAQEATDVGLDRDPQVLRAVERTRRQILAEAFLERNLKVSRPSTGEIRAFYEENPALFQNRRIYSFRDFVIDRSQYSDNLRGMLDAARTHAGVDGILRAANVKYREAESMRSAEQLPLDMLPRVAAMKKGEIAALRSDSTVVLMQLIDFAEQPLTFGQAVPDIEQFLINARRKQLTESKIKDLRRSARIAYLSPYLNRQNGDKFRTVPRHEVAAPGTVLQSVVSGTELAKKDRKYLSIK